jgi:hypothetical protein
MAPGNSPAPAWSVSQWLNAEVAPSLEVIDRQGQVQLRP